MKRQAPGSVTVLREMKAAPSFKSVWTKIETQIEAARADDAVAKVAFWSTGKAPMRAHSMLEHTKAVLDAQSQTVLRFTTGDGTA